MFGKFLAFFLALGLTTSFVGCADPTYVTGDGNSANSGGQSKLGATCAAKFAASSACIQISWVKKPTEKNPGEFTFRAFRFDDDDGFPIAVDLVATPSVVLWMPAMGHGSSPVTVTSTKGGAYRATDVFFIMPGEWQIKFQIKNGEAVTDEAIVDYVF